METQKKKYHKWTEEERTYLNKLVHVNTIEDGMVDWGKITTEMNAKFSTQQTSMYNIVKSYQK